MRLIDKDALVREIERRIKTNKECMLGLRNLDYYQGKVDALNGTISFLDTLEVKEVDLEEDVDDFISGEYHDYIEYEHRWIEEKDWKDSIRRCSEHFFALGLKAQRGE